MHPVAKFSLEHPVKARSRRSKPWWMKVVFCGAWRAWSKKTIWAIVVLIPIIRLTVNKFWMLLMKYGCHIPFPSVPASRQPRNEQGQAKAFIGLLLIRHCLRSLTLLRNIKKEFLVCWPLGGPKPSSQCGEGLTEICLFTVWLSISVRMGI